MYPFTNSVRTGACVSEPKSGQVVGIVEIEAGGGGGGGEE